MAALLDQFGLPLTDEFGNIIDDGTGGAPAYVEQASVTGRPSISLLAAIGASTGLNHPFIIGQSLIGGTDLIAGREIVGQGSWEEIGDRCIRVTTSRGRQRQLEQYRAGTLSTLLDNTDGALDPTWAAGPYTANGVSRIRPMVAVHLSAFYAGVAYDMYSGFADAWHPILEYPEGGLTELAATDAFKIFTRIDPSEQPFDGLGDTTGARLNRILEVAAWSPWLRDIDTGIATHQSTNLAQPIASQLRLAADSERGDLYIGAEGQVTFRDRLSRYLSPRSLTPQWVFGDRSDQLNPTSFEPMVNDDLVKNDVHVARAGGTTIVRRDPDVELLPYLWSTYTRTDLTLLDDDQVVQYADFVLRTFGKAPAQRVDSVTFEPDGYPELWPVVLGARFGDRVTVDFTHPYTGNRYTGDYFIEGIDHDIGSIQHGEKWRTVFHLSDAAMFPRNPFIIGYSLIGSVAVIV